MPLSKETLALISTFKSPIITWLSDMKDEVNYFLDSGLGVYVDNIRGKYIKTKTFLYRQETVDFYEVYFPITLSTERNVRYDVNGVSDFFSETNFISVIGNAGSGKTMLLKHIFLSTIKELFKIPIVIELRQLNENTQDLLTYISKTITSNNLAPNEKILKRLLKEGQFLFLFDGYDEIFSNKKELITNDLISFCDQYPNNYFLITSRPGANVESLPRFNALQVDKLSMAQVINFIYQQIKHSDDNKLAEKIIKVVQKPENSSYSSYLSSPLLLSMFILTFNSYPELPKFKNKFYWNVFDTLCTKHDSFTKQGGYQHERKSGLSIEELEKLLKWFSYTSLFNGRYDFDAQYLNEKLNKLKEKLEFKCSVNDIIHDLTVAISVIIIDGLFYKFPHKSLQEYFTVLLIKDLPEKTKEKIYTEKLKDYFLSSYDNLENIYDLFLEVDKTCFQKYYLLPILREFIGLFSSDNEKHGSEFNEIFDFGFTFHKSFKTYKLAEISYGGNIYLNLLRYFKIFKTPFELISDKNYSSNDINQLINQQAVQIFKRNKHTFFRIQDFGEDDGQNKVLKRLGYNDKVEDILKRVKIFIQQLEQEIQTDQEMNVELLNL